MSLAMLYPGLTLDILTIQIAPTLPIVGKMELFIETRSIVGTIENLYKHNNALVGNLILLFSVIIPIVKGILLFISLFAKQLKVRFKLFHFVRTIGKWSMADVFIVGIFVAFLSTGSMDGIDATIEHGFYYFVGYCLLSILSTQIITFNETDHVK
jgi:uncharacterized paraquat-inducible protein A